MDVLLTFGVIAGIVFIGYLAELIFKKTNIPDVLLLIGIGILIGTVWNWVNTDSFGESSKLFSTFALVFLLFQGSLNIDFKTLFKSLSSTAKLTLISFIFTVTIVSAISYFIFDNFLIALLTGTILAGTSSAVVIPLVSNIEIKNKYGLVLTLESAISDVLCIIGSITILGIIETGDFVFSAIFKNILSSFSLALVLGLFAGFAWIAMLDKFETLSKSYMVTVAAVIGLYAFVEGPYVGASGAIAALTFGLMLGNSKIFLQMMHKGKKNKNSEDDPDAKIIRNVLSGSAKNFYSEISFFVKTFFFVYLGILIDFSNLTYFIYGAALVLGIYLIRPYVVKLVFWNEKLDDKERTILEVLIPKGLAAAVLAGLAIQSPGLSEFSGSFVNIILSVVFMSIVLTSILIFLSEKQWFRGLQPFLAKKNVELSK